MMIQCVEVRVEVDDCRDQMNISMLGLACGITCNRWNPLKRENDLSDNKSSPSRLGLQTDRPHLKLRYHFDRQLDVARVGEGEM
jgi:hypothetical protein